MESPSSEDPIPPPTTWGRLALTRPLGQGANGAVYLAHDPESGEEVALKILRSRDPWALEGFKNEARYLADLAHPSLVAPDELVSHEGALGLVMRYVDGRPFTDALAEAAGPAELGALRDEARVRRLLGGLFEALAALHERGLVHLDIKPENVLVTARGDVVLLDFGLARLGASASRPGEMAGSAAWMAPEQLMLDAITPAADVFAAGLLIFKALAGASAWDPTDDVMARLVAPPRDLLALRPGLSPELGALVHGLLVREPKDRPDPATLALRFAEAGRPEARARLPATLPFTGRAVELGQLLALLDGVAAGVPALVRVQGDPGTGKTALVQRFEALARGRGAVVVAGRCFAAEHIPFKALDAALDQLADLARARPDVAKALAGSPDLPALARVFPIFGTFLQGAGGAAQGDPVDDDPRRARSLMRDVVRRLSLTSPIVLAVDDAHWGDADAVDVLLSLLEPPDPARVLLVLTHRRGDAWSGSAFASALERRLDKGVPFALTTLEVDRLLPADARALAHKALGHDADGAAIDSLLAAAGGNALVLTRLLAEPDAAGLDLPALVRRSLERFPPAVGRFATFVALAGVPRRIGEIARAARVPIPSRAELSALAVEALVRPAYEASGRVVMPHHDLVRQALVDRVPREERPAAHLALAEALAEHARSLDDLGHVATHFSEAGRKAEAVQWALRAAEAAERASAFARQAELLALAMASGARTRTLELRQAHALRESGRGREAARVYQDLAASAPEAALRRTHLRAAADTLMTIGAIDEGLALLGPVFAELGIEPRSGGVRRTLRLAGGALAILARLERGRPARHADARAAERFDTSWPVAKSLMLVEPLVGLDEMLRSLRFAEASGDPERVARVTGPLAGFVLGSLPGFKTTAERWVAALAARGDEPYFAGAEALWRAFLAGGQGRLVEAMESAHRAIDHLALADGVYWERVQALSVLGRVLVSRGQYTTVMSLTQSHVPDAARRGDLHAQIVLSSYRLLPVLAAGRVDELRAICDWTLRTWLPDRYSPQSFYALRALRMAELIDGRAEVAARELAAGRAPFQRAGGYRIVFSRMDHDLIEARTVLALGDGDAPGLWPIERLVARLEKLAMPEGRAHAALLGASLAARARRRAEAVETLERAAALLDAAGVDLEAWVARLRLAELGGDDMSADAARRALHQLGVADPDRWAAVVAPGYDGLLARR